jgi:hypothetical protein
MNKEQISGMIQETYSSSPENKKIADLCLELGHDWTKVVGKDLYRLNQNIAKKQCSRYIQDNFDRSQVKGGLLTTIFLSVIIRVIANWIANLIVKKD